MRLIKTFTTGYCDITDMVNDFIKTNNVIPVSVNIIPLHDRYYDGNICNQWLDTILIYDEVE